MSNFALRMLAAMASGGEINNDPYWSNTSILLHLNGTNDTNTPVIDSTGINTATANGGLFKTAEKKFGTASMYFDGNDWIDIPQASSNDLIYTEDFTVELWFNTTTTSETGYMLSKYSDNNIPWTGWMIGLNAGKVHMHVGGGSYQTSTASTTYNDGNWHHLAWTNNTSTSRIFVDGENISMTSGLSWATPSGIYRAGMNFWVGRADTVYYTGYIDEIRITKGIARYIDSFTSPTAEFPNA